MKLMTFETGGRESDLAEARLLSAQEARLVRELEYEKIKVQIEIQNVELTFGMTLSYTTIRLIGMKPIRIGGRLMEYVIEVVMASATAIFPICNGNQFINLSLGR